MSASFLNQRSRTLTGQHRRIEFVRLADLMCSEAGRLMQRVFPGCLKRVDEVPGVHRTAISRARAGCTSNPAYRLTLWFLALRATGATKERAQMAVNHCQLWIARLWPSSEVPGALELAPRLQEIDAAEDVARTAFLCSPCPETAEQWRRTLEDQAALAPLAIQALCEEAGNA